MAVTADYEMRSSKALRAAARRAPSQPTRAGPGAWPGSGNAPLIDDAILLFTGDKPMSAEDQTRTCRDLGAEGHALRWHARSSAGRCRRCRPNQATRKDVMSRTTAPRPTAHPLGRLDARRRAARSQQELRAVLAGEHGEGVRADVLAAMKR